MKSFSFAVAILALVHMKQVFAGPSMALFCSDDSRQNTLEAFDLDPKARIYSIRGKHQSLPEHSRNFSFVLSFDANDFKTKVESFDPKQVDLLVQNDQGQTLELFFQSPEVGQQASLGFLKTLRLFNLSPQKIDFFDQRQGNATLILDNEAKTVLEFTHCQFSGANVDDWHEMWNRP